LATDFSHDSGHGQQSAAELLDGAKNVAGGVNLV